MYPNGNPQYPPPQGQIYPNLYNPSNAPPQPQPHYPGYPNQGQYQPNQGQYQPNQGPYHPNQGQYQPNQGQYQPNPAYSYQTGHPAAMSYPTAAPTAPPGVGFGYPNITPTPAYGMPTIEWIPSTPATAASLSDRAVVGGYEGHDGSPLWVIRARFEGDLIPGKLAIKHNAAYIPWGGSENAVHNIEVLCARPEKIRWVEKTRGVIVPPNAIVAGNTVHDEPLYVGRAKHQGSLTPGKVHPSHKSMYISFGGEEIAYKSYEVLCTI